jgi:hypothetical protein
MLLTATVPLLSTNALANQDDSSRIKVMVAPANPAVESRFQIIGRSTSSGALKAVPASPTSKPVSGEIAKATPFAAPDTDEDDDDDEDEASTTKPAGSPQPKTKQLPLAPGKFDPVVTSKMRPGERRPQR